MHKLLIASLIFLSTVISPLAQAEIDDQVAVQKFTGKMVDQHQFAADALAKLFKSVEIKPNIIAAMTRPAEGMPWYKYRKIFMRDSRIQGGVKFWQKNQASLKLTAQRYGVPEEIIVAIIGVETLYGERTGGHRVIDALATLAFDYPKRSKFFLSELEQFLLLCREEKINPLEPMGSYAGAMGMPQFMPSSYRHYAVDFEGDMKRDIWHNPADTIASVANYFAKHHWQTGQDIAFVVQANGDKYKQALTKGLSPNMTVKQLQNLGVQVPKQVAAQERVRLLSFEQEHGDDLWIGLNNFYVITRYNHSPLYAMAVFQLSAVIKQQYRLASHG
ncbi:lytic murein transglycosylase B [methanotrophic endosymbiont of Bathymodiolus puteoserpentis (Logatchev)]|jgi:membrane-bound lytic murein transglycosylase B|uniref:lytic murein transglycosylase B n=1 Tax=methanotrophic endosymbiont of Bathymodiolus puteoserpentis (Logatchev) TaxID=343235 RepID=UPI0013CBC729|nr:lytic murein transglycosylase B [methanotrophic endosymbiont of Bathymodiolus puteoserpentis (Logatchev)]SHE22664.1 Membrane-bound lytic murein transglycosylase B precursor [methanotrophic endosymbiont of Bathymodiolus puteoserpentis (Logatchev)]